jgi:hypothetical protein
MLCVPFVAVNARLHDARPFRRKGVFRWLVLLAGIALVYMSEDFCG